MKDGERLRLASDEVHSWCVSLAVAPEAYARLHATLTGDERDRAAQFRFERDRQRFVVARGVLRDLLGRYLETDPGEIRFAYNAFGKPALCPEFGSRLRFNLSHSADLALIAVARDADVGVDVEYVRADPDYADIARHFFSAAELDDLSRLPKHLYAAAFLGCWTRKEAWMKASGEGFAVAPRRGAWSLYTVHPAPGYIGALAIEGSGRQCQSFRTEHAWHLPTVFGDRLIDGIESRCGESAAHPKRL